MKRPALTVLLIKSDMVARADFSAGTRPALAHVWRTPRPGQSGLTELVNAAIALGGKCGRNVWVLCEDLWTQMLSFPVVKLAGLDDAQLVRAFAFEAEPLSGISGMDAVAGYFSTGVAGDRRSVWVTLTDSFTRNQIQSEVQRAGGKLNGICHPAGVPAPLTANADNETWSRVEVWQQITLCLGGHGNAIDQTEIVNAGSTQARAQASISSWMAGEAVQHCELLEAHENAQLPPALEHPERSLALSSEKDLAVWLEAWMRALVAASKNVPVIRPIPQATPKYLYALVGIAAALLVIALCSAHWLWTDQSKKQWVSAAAEYRGAAQRLSDLKKQVDDTKKESHKLTIENDKAEQLQAGLERDFAQQRSRILLLLRKLAEKRPPDTVIQGISEDALGTLQIKGTTLEASFADQLALDLSAELGASDWSVRPLEKEGGKLLENGGPWKFTLGVVELNSAASALKSPAVTNSSVSRRREH